MMAFALVANAQGRENDRSVGSHWTFNPYTQYDMTLTGVLFLDGEAMQNQSRTQYLEVAAFCGDECRGSYMATNYNLPFFQGYVYFMQIYSQVESGEEITFRIWDHEAGEELDVNCLSDITFESYGVIGSLTDPYALAFLTNRHITVEANPVEGGTVSGGGTYVHGTSCTLTAVADTAYNFVNWTKGGTVVTTDDTYTFTVNEDATYTANFELKTFNMTATATPAVGGSATGGGI